MDYFYLSKKGPSGGIGGQALSTKELQKRLRDLGKSPKGSRSELIKRYDKEVQNEESERDPEEKSASSMQPPKSHASENPMMVMVDEATGNKYMRVVDHKGLQGDGDNSWLVKDMHQELKSWGHPGGPGNALILQSDGEPAIVAAREALAPCHGGCVSPEQPPVGEHQSNGAAEEAGRTVRDQARVLNIQFQTHSGRT